MFLFGVSQIAKITVQITQLIGIIAVIWGTPFALWSLVMTMLTYFLKTQARYTPHFEQISCNTELAFLV